MSKPLPDLSGLFLLGPLAMLPKSGIFFSYDPKISQLTARAGYLALLQITLLGWAAMGSKINIIQLIEVNQGCHFEQSNHVHDALKKILCRLLVYSTATHHISSRSPVLDDGHGKVQL